MRRFSCAAALVCLCLPGSLLLAQTAPADPSAAPPADPPAAGSPADPNAAAPAPAATSEWSVGPINFSGLIDAYYSANFNHPASRENQLRNFDVKANQFSLNMAKLTMDHTPDPLGFRVDLGFGRAFDIVNSAEKAPDIIRIIEQAFVSYKPEKAKGLQVDFGKFVTWAGAEVIETYSNWNYSRSLLFSYGIPYYHFGLRATQPIGKHFTGGVSLTNGWNNVEDNNSGKTVGLTGTVSVGKVSWTNNYYLGPEKADTNHGRRHLYDTTVLVTPNPRTSFYLNFDYGVDKNVPAGEQRWVGVAGAARVAVNSWLAFAPRLEWFNDADGFATGTAQKLKEATLTAEVKFKEGILGRLEYRRDWSNVPFFDRGGTPASSRRQPTLLAGFVAYFGPKR